MFHVMEARPDERSGAPGGRFTPCAARPRQVAASLAYLKPTQERPYTYMYDPPGGQARENFEIDSRQSPIIDARSVAASASIQVEGFSLWDAASAVADFHDDEAVRNVYYREAAELALVATGAKQAHVFDHLVRLREAGRPALTIGRGGDGSKPAANGRIHNDYTEASGRKRLELVLGDAAAAVERFSIVNIWRSIRGPVLDTPLAVCDA